MFRREALKHGAELLLSPSAAHLQLTLRVAPRHRVSITIMHLLSPSTAHSCLKSSVPREQSQSTLDVVLHGLLLCPTPLSWPWAASIVILRAQETVALQMHSYAGWCKPSIKQVLSINDGSKHKHQTNTGTWMSASRIERL